MMLPSWVSSSGVKRTDLSGLSLRSDLRSLLGIFRAEAFTSLKTFSAKRETGLIPEDQSGGRSQSCICSSVLPGAVHRVPGPKPIRPFFRIILV